MKKILIAGLLLSGLAFAETTPTTQIKGEGHHKCMEREGENCPMKGEGKSLEEIKSKINEKMDERKQCVNNATTKEALKECRPKHKDGKGERHEKHEKRNTSETK